ncbi:alpha carbonic anhydrase 6-like [Cryptomeria japonica]|uniref:alpha carbonic anhydrase 6-like n=1 Tax=Cryptomeria japonica TaxID=3369 RepID=UPI0027D9E317|nr:alpha carbonic anhydrase 6-like [Cryptomeria japonica]
MQKYYHSDDQSQNVRWPTGGGSLVINGRNYMLKQCRWHSPAEHSVDGIIYPLEFQMEHQTQDNSSAIVSMLYSYGKPNTFLTKVNWEPPKEPLGLVDPFEIIVPDKEYYRYSGSLSTPICREGVIWSVLEKF